MTKTTESVERLMKRCQIGCGGRQALDDAHDILAECYGTLGALVQDRDALRARIDRAFVMAATKNGVIRTGTNAFNPGKRIALVPLDD